MVVGGLGGEADPDDEADRFREVGEGEFALNLLVQQGPARKFRPPFSWPRQSLEVPWRQA